MEKILITISRKSLTGGPPKHPFAYTHVVERTLFSVSEKSKQTDGLDLCIPLLGNFSVKIVGVFIVQGT